MHLLVEDLSINWRDPFVALVRTDNGHAPDGLVSGCDLPLTVTQCVKVKNLFKEGCLPLIKLIETYRATHQEHNDPVHLHRVMHGYYLLSRWWREYCALNKTPTLLVILEVYRVVFTEGQCEGHIGEVSLLS